MAFVGERLKQMRHILGGYYRSLSNQLHATVLTVKESGGVRQYTRSNANGTREYFRCRRCCAMKRKYGGDVAARIITNNGQIVGDKYPKHHERCELIPVEYATIKAVDRQGRFDVRSGRKDPKEAHHEPAIAFSVEVMNSWNSVTSLYFRFQSPVPSHTKGADVGEKGLNETKVDIDQSLLDNGMSSVETVVQDDDSNHSVTSRSYGIVKTEESDSAFKLDPPSVEVSSDTSNSPTTTLANHQVLWDYSYIIPQSSNNLDIALINACYNQASMDTSQTSESIEKYVRNVYEVNRSLGERLQSEILEVIKKYEYVLEGNQ
ncbi:unnamed protein product [Anisakis simplex]|uniref:FLYWCH-type domain-containing protein n=1 Tax=Anisakis simplex TaxID=6269 RepID=A0A0M3K0P7_ANISI|nr:unnamed protein product [Anisakis simplex]